MRSKFDPPEQKQTDREKDRETDRVGGTGEGGTEAEGGAERNNRRRKWNQDGPGKGEI